MYLDLSGEWKISLETKAGVQTGTIVLPGILQGQGYGNPIDKNTPWVSSLHDSFWYEQEEYKVGQENGCQVPFLAQPPLHFLGKAFYEKAFEVTEDSEEEWYLRIEQTRWRSSVWLDEKYMGEDCSLCTAHEIPCGWIPKGKHVLKVCIDNSMQYPYRPDGHGVSDALGVTWNGMAGEIRLETASERATRKSAQQAYAKAHPRHMEVRDGAFYVDGKPEYFRATHFGGEYPLTGYPCADKAWWQNIMRIIKDWGLNAIRCHSYCPPEIAFQVADEEGIYLLVECGMWNRFSGDEECKAMLDVLRKETRRILEQFGHHPSFAFFSPTNEPSGYWYDVLRNWVAESKAYDKELGYEGRRLYTAQSGWFFEVSPAEIIGTDFIYFHRSAYGPYFGGKIRGDDGWRGKDYSPSLEECKLPVVCHELGQWCAYPDFRVIDKFTGYLQPSNYKVFRAHAERQGVLPLMDDFVYCSGRNQLRLYKEELEANYRTPEITGFELLDLHDYLGQGTALVGFLDPFWDSKGYATPEEFREFCGETVLLAKCSSYVWRNSQAAEIPVEISHFGKEALTDVKVQWALTVNGNEVQSGEIDCGGVRNGGNTQLGDITLDFTKIHNNCKAILSLAMVSKTAIQAIDDASGTVGTSLEEAHLSGMVRNHWDLYVYVEETEKSSIIDRLNTVEEQADDQVLYTRDWQDAEAALKRGKRVIYNPWLSDLDYECPSLSIKNVYWNSQMGPTWGRNLGLVVEDSHPIFKDFPTERSGGWQWEDILDFGRAFHMKGMEQIHPIVRVIDDWNRSLPLAMLFEAKVGDGSLLVVTADLDGEVSERPTAYHLKQAILHYAMSEEFCPKTVIPAESIAEKLFSVRRMEQLAENCHYEETVEVKNPEAIFSADPQASVRMEKKSFPVSFVIDMRHEVEAEGFLYLPEQRDRGHEGFLKDYRIEYWSEESAAWEIATEGMFLNTSLSQKALFDKEIKAKRWRFTVFSCYGCVEKKIWKQKKDGWHHVTVPEKAVLQIAGIHVICKEESGHSNKIFWEKRQHSATKEIEA